MKKKKYLKMTIHDRSFQYSLEIVANLLHNLFEDHMAFFGEEGLNFLTAQIQMIWTSINNLDCKLSGLSIVTGSHNFMPDLSFVYEDDIPDQDSEGSAYIPLFYSGRVIIR